VPTYYGSFMTLGWASLEPAHRRTTPAEIERRIAAAGIATRYYNPGIHQACFQLPNYVLARLG
jgi:spermidine synthase